MGKKSAPPPPNYTAIANQQGQISQDLTNQQTAANRPDLYTPWGSQTWSSTKEIDPATGKPVTSWQSQINLSPQQQAALDSQMRLQTGRSMGAEMLLQNALQGFGIDLNPNSYAFSSGQQGGTTNQTPSGSRNPAAWQSAVTQGLSGSRMFQNMGGDIRQTGAPTNQLAGKHGALPPQPQAGGQPGQAPQGSASPIDYSGISAGGQGNISAPNMQTQLGNVPAIQQQLQNTAGDWRQQGQNAALQFQQPLQQQRQSQLETQLANQGIARGSEAWNNEMRALQDQNARDNLQAFGAGQSEAQLLFGMDAARGQFANQAQQQAYQQALGRGQFNNQALQQQLGGQIQAGNFNQQLRQQQIAEMMQRRSQPLNELNALLTGQQVGMPQMPSFNSAQRPETPNLLGAAGMQYQAGLDAANANSGLFGGAMGGLFNLGGAALSNGGWGGLFNFGS